MPTLPLGRPVQGLVDIQGRRLDYLRLAVTDRCNLRCRYCMPAEGLPLHSHHDMLTFEEAERLVQVLVGLGVRKLRITGGEPLVRRGTTAFMTRLARAHPELELLLTTNGLLLRRHLPDLRAAGVSRINLSLDSLDPETWTRLTRREGHDKVLAAMEAVLAAGLGLKINMVVVAGVNDHEIPAFAALTREHPIEVRFIEAMAFDGSGGARTAPFPATRIADTLAASHGLMPLPERPTEVARRYVIPGHAGKVGIIAGHGRTFCGTCNRLRIDPRGRLRTCLYGGAGPDLRALVRDGVPDTGIAEVVCRALAARHADGTAAGLAAVTGGGESMASIGG